MRIWIIDTETNGRYFGTIPDIAFTTKEAARLWTERNKGRFRDDIEFVFHWHAVFDEREVDEIWPAE